MSCAALALALMQGPGAAEAGSARGKPSAKQAAARKAAKADVGKVSVQVKPGKARSLRRVPKSNPGKTTTDKATTAPAQAKPAKTTTAKTTTAKTTSKTIKTSKASTRQRQVQQVQQRQLTPQQQKEAAIRKAEKEVVKRHAQERVSRVRGLSRIFRKITVDRDYKGEFVLQRDNHTTAFLDITDPQHPGFKPEKETGEADLDSIPIHKRAHILVVPNAPREHITNSLGGTITSADLQASLDVVKSAEKLAKQLGIKNPRVFMNPESRVMIGYLHVHIIGERTAQTRYPKPLANWRQDGLRGFND